MGSPHQKVWEKEQSLLSQLHTVPITRREVIYKVSSVLSISYELEVFTFRIPPREMNLLRTKYQLKDLYAQLANSLRLHLTTKADHKENEWISRTDNWAYLHDGDVV